MTDLLFRMIPKNILSELQYAVQSLTALKDYACLLDRKKNLAKYEKLAIEEELNKIRDSMKSDLDKIREDLEDELERIKEEN